jgi:hypothetical protein
VWMQAARELLFTSKGSKTSIEIADCSDPFALSIFNFAEPSAGSLSRV